jgi:DNA-binding NtrC family response regulator
MRQHIVAMHQSCLNPAPDEEVALHQSATGKEDSHRILVVEADAILRTAMVAAIGAAGFRAIEAETGDGALRCLDRHGDIALVFTAINIPGNVDGVALAVQIHRDWPDIAIVITSGIVSLRQSSLPRRCRFLKKPYRPDDAIVCFRLLLELDREIPVLGPQSRHADVIGVGTN